MRKRRRNESTPTLSKQINQQANIELRKSKHQDINDQILMERLYRLYIIHKQQCSNNLITTSTREHRQNESTPTSVKRSQPIKQTLN